MKIVKILLQITILMLNKMMNRNLMAISIKIKRRLIQVMMKIAKNKRKKRSLRKRLLKLKILKTKTTKKKKTKTMK